MAYTILPLLHKHVKKTSLKQILFKKHFHNITSMTICTSKLLSSKAIKTALGVVIEHMKS